MSLLLASLNARGLRDTSNASRLREELRSLGVDVAAVQETHFISDADGRVLGGNHLYEVYSAFGDLCGRGVSLLVKSSLGAVTDIVYAGAGGRLIVADIAVASNKFRVIAVYAPHRPGERGSFLRQLGPYIAYPGRLVLMGDWNAILDPNLDRTVRGASGSGRCDSGLSDLMAQFDLVDRYRVSHPGRRMWTWTNRRPSDPIKSYLDRVLVRRADVDILDCPVFHLYAWSDHKLLTVALRLNDRPRLVSYWKLNTSVFGIRDYRERLAILLQRALVGAVIGNKWWADLKFRIKDFTIKYCQRLALDKAAKVKAIEDKISRALDGGDPLAVDLARGDLEREASERYQGCIVRSRLNRVSNEAVNLDAGVRREELRRFPDRYIGSVVTPDGQTLCAGRKMREAFRAHFQERFTRLPNLQVLEMHYYLADFPHLREAKAASCEGRITDSEVQDALKQVGLNKAPGLDGLPYELYLRMSHIFVPILTDVFNNWFTLGRIPKRITKGVITLLKKGGRNVWEGLDDYRPITLLNTELKILARVLANRLRLVVGDLIELEQNYAVKGRSIQNNLHLIRMILEGIKDDQCAALISLDQSKAFDRVDHRFLEAVLETAGFQPEFRKWIGIMYQSPTAVVQVNGKRSGVFPIERSVRQGCPLSPLLYVLALEPLLRRLRGGWILPVLRGMTVPGPVKAKLSAYANDITVFVSSVSEIVAVNKVLARYEKITGAKINLEKSEGLRLGAWAGSANLPGPFRWSDGPIKILGVWFGPDLQIDKNWSEVQTKVETRIRRWFPRRLSLKGRAEACATYIFPLILYRLSVLPLPANRLIALERALFHFLWRGGRPMVRRQVCSQRPCNGGLGMPDLAAHRNAERLAFLNRALHTRTAWSRKFRDIFPDLLRRSRCSGGETQFLSECRVALRRLPESSDVSWPRRALYRALVEGSGSDPLVERHGSSLEEVRSQWSWAPGAGIMNNSEFSLTWRLARNALPLASVQYRANIADFPSCTRCNSGLEETAEHAFFHCSRVHQFWEYVNEVTARIAPNQWVPLDVGYIVDNVSPPFSGEKQKVFFAILAVARMVVWTTRNKELHGSEELSCRDLITYFKHQLRVKIRCDRRMLKPMTFNERWINAASLCVRTRAGVEVLLPAVHGWH